MVDCFTQQNQTCAETKCD